MKTFPLVLLAGISLCFSGCLALPSPVSSSTIVDKTESATTLPSFSYISEQHDPYGFVGSFRRENNSLIGSGSLISPYMVLTAAHVVDGDDIEYFNIGGTQHQITDIIIHDEYKSLYNAIKYDIAIVILCEPSDVMPVDIYKSRTMQGMPLTTVGFGTGYKRFSTRDTFWYYGRLLNEPWEFIMLPLKDTIWFGDSGGAVLCNGKIIGVMSSFSMYDDSIYENASTYVPYFNKWIEEVSNEQLVNG